MDEFDIRTLRSDRRILPTPEPREPEATPDYPGVKCQRSDG